MTDTAINAYIVYGGRYRHVVRVAGLALVVAIVATSTPSPSLGGRGLVILVALVVATGAEVAAVALPGRAVLARTVVGAVGSGVLVGYDPGASVALFAFAGLDAGANLALGPGLIVTLLAVVLEVLAALASGRGAAGGEVGLIVAAGFLAATSLKQYVLRFEDAEQRLADAERAREEHAQAVRMAERANAAREIHDILAHSLGALVLQLDALDALLTAEPPDVGRARPLVGQARLLAVEGLGEARQAVGGLRSGPAPLVESLRRLVDGPHIGTFKVTGTPRSVSSDASLALRRATQEGLANAAKHAPGAVPEVWLAFEPDAVVLTVTDSGPPGGAGPSPLAATGGGYGLEGLRERAAQVGGTLVAESKGPGWQVCLTVPASGTGAGR